MSETFDVVVSRTFSVPPEEAWRAWSESDLVKQWWDRLASVARWPMLIFASAVGPW
jgi:uncharacterized protein YndB with AHSA1/START domain